MTTPTLPIEPAPVEAAPTRKVGLLLGIGIFFVPWIFGWAMLQKGRSTFARCLTFAWFALYVVGNVLTQMNIGKEPARQTQVAAPKAVSSEDRLAEYKFVLNKLAYHSNVPCRRLGKAGDILTMPYASVNESSELIFNQIVKEAKAGGCL